MCEIYAGKQKGQSPPKKRSLFSKQVLAKGSAANDPVDFFSRAKKVHPKLLEEEEEKRQSKIRRTKRRESSRSIEEGKFSNEQTSDSNNKTRSGSQSDSEDDIWTERISKSPLCNRDSKESDDLGSNCRGQGEVAESKRKSRLKKPSPLNTHEPSNVIINLDSDEESPRISTTSTEKNYLDSLPLHSSITERQLEISDEEYPELIQQAREREKSKAQQRLIAANYSEGQKLQKSAETSYDIFETEPKSAPELDPTIELLITSELEGTRPLRIKRRFSQRLKEARITWCDKQNIQTDSAGRPLQDVIFFTWQGKRVFDVTTCGSLGFKLNKNGRLTHIRDNSDTSGKIHLEAWTEDALKLKEKISASQVLEDGESGKHETDVIPAEKGPSFKLIMKARDMEPFKIVVKPKTSIAKMAEAFRRAKSIPENTKISLHFDGDILDPKSTIEETELGDTEDVDTIEVYLK